MSAVKPAGSMASMVAPVTFTRTIGGAEQGRIGTRIDGTLT
jgi:hypothetical protein